jgi:hypothetical protein
LIGESNHYTVLEIGRNADAETIRRAYRRLARQFHPDVYKGVDATARMQRLNHAHEVLSDPLQRRAYDATLPRPQTKITQQPDAQMHTRPGPQQTTANTYHGYASKAEYDEAWRQHQERYSWYQEPRQTDWRANPSQYRFKQGWYQGEAISEVFRQNPEFLWRLVLEDTDDLDDSEATKAFLRKIPRSYADYGKVQPPDKGPFIVAAITLELLFGWFSTTFISSHKNITGKDDLGSYVFNIGVYSIAIVALLCYFTVRSWQSFAAYRKVKEMKRLLNQD